MLGALTAISFAQIKPAEQPIQEGFSTLRGHPGLKVSLEGSQQIGDRITPFTTTAYWFQDVEDGRTMAKLEMVVTWNGSQSFRVVADGVTLWIYDNNRREYSATRYGNYNGAQPDGYANSLLAAVKSIAKGQCAYPIRLLSEVYGGEQPRYTTWIPGTAIEDTGSIVRYMLGTPVRRRLEFSYMYVAPYMNIRQIDYFDEISFQDASREITWTLVPTSFDLILGDANFAFIPPAGSRSVVGVRSVTVG
jgi:hypothetical protein